MKPEHHHSEFDAPAMGEPYLLTPGPLTTAASVKQAMLRDWEKQLEYAPNVPDPDTWRGAI